MTRAYVMFPFTSLFLATPHVLGYFGFLDTSARLNGATCPLALPPPRVLIGCPFDWAMEFLEDHSEFDGLQNPPHLRHQFQTASASLFTLQLFVYDQDFRVSNLQSSHGYRLRFC